MELVAGIGRKFRQKRSVIRPLKSVDLNIKNWVCGVVRIKTGMGYEV